MSNAKDTEPSSNLALEDVRKYISENVHMEVQVQWDYGDHSLVIELFIEGERFAQDSISLPQLSCD